MLRKQKKIRDDIRLKNLRIITMANHAAKPRTEEGSTTIPWWLTPHQEYGSTLRVGEIPLNGKGLPLTGNAEGEEIVYSHVKA